MSTGRDFSSFTHILTSLPYSYLDFFSFRLLYLVILFFFFACFYVSEMLPTVNKFSPASRSKPEPLSFDIYLEHDSSAAMNARLTVEFIKLLCFQKGLIPVTCNQLSSRLVSIRQHSISLEDVSLMVSQYLLLCIFFLVFLLLFFFICL